MIVLIRITDAFEYDNFHKDGETLYRVISKITNHEGKHWKLASTPLPLKASLLNDSEKNVITQLYPAIQTVAKDVGREFNANGVFIESNFFDVFGFTLTFGNAAALSEPNKILLSQSFAEKFYGDMNPVGHSLTLGKWGEFEIAGVVNTPSSKSHIAYDMYVSMASVPSLEQTNLLPRRVDSWDSFEQGYTYIKANTEITKHAVEVRLASIARDINKFSAETNPPEKQATFEFELQQVSSITPGRADIYNDMGRGPSQGSLLAEAGIVMIILLAACFNYTNLSVARGLTRGKEVGIRKLSGAQRWQIFAQYVTESILLALFALLIANLIVAPILEFKPFNDGYEMVPSITISLKLLLVFIVFAVFAGLLAGAFPAWILSSFRPARILRGIGSEKVMGNLSFRKILMVFQFSLSLIILIFLSTFYQQFDFMAKADLGYSRENIVLIPSGNNSLVTETSINKLPSVYQTGFTSGSFGSGDQIKVSRQSLDPEGVQSERYQCDEAWLSITNLQFVAGANQLQNSSSAIINEKAVIALGFEDAEEAVGSVVYVSDSIPVTVTGVVKDFYSRGYGRPIQPLLFHRDENMKAYLAVHAQEINATFISELGTAWKKQNAVNSFEYIWLDEEMNAKNDQSAEISLLGFLGFMTVTIALLGLLGLVVYTIETRRKEVSVRKIIGASVRQLMTLLSGGFVKLLVISGVIALPIGYLLSALFLMNFVNRVNITVLDLMFCFMILLGVGLITILSQTWKASLENPSKNLRSE